ncbi:MAG: restriction endonuclease subunit S [Magnetococcales bacterium]|nr:restriction endonuclease subunit S [Magnetococcales bacterium]
MKMVPLGEVVHINPRMPKSAKNGSDRPVSFLPMALVLEDGTIAKEEQRALSDVLQGYTYFERDDVIFAKITPCFENGKAAHLRNLGTQIGFGSTEFHVLRPGTYMDARYLFHMVWNPRFRFVASKKMAGAAGQKRVPVDAVREYKIPLPPLPEQKRIAAILDKADAIRRKRRQALALADQFLRAVFLEMFGDPVTNPKGWDTVLLGDLVSDMRYGTSQKCSEKKEDGDLPVLRIPNISENEVNWEDLKYTKLTQNEADRLMLCKGDLLFVRTNGNPEYIARCAVFSGNAIAVFASYLIRVRISKDANFLPDFLQFLASMPTFRGKIIKETKTTAGNYNINTEGLRSLRFIFPSIELQSKFILMKEKVASSIDIGRGQHAEGYQLFSTLTQRAFRGEFNGRDH